MKLKINTMIYPPKNSFFFLLFQFLGTVLILVAIPWDIPKLCLFLLFWYSTFSPFTKKELVAFVILSFVMTLNDIAVVSKGIFFFTTQDFFGIPYFQTVLWAFYFLFWTRLYTQKKLEVSKKRFLSTFILLVVLLGTLYVAETHNLKLFALAILFFFTTLFFHTKSDWYMLFSGVCTGLIIELAGTLSSQWYYTGNFLGMFHIPYWLFFIWALSAWIVGQILFPLLHKKRRV